MGRLLLLAVILLFVVIAADAEIVGMWLFDDGKGDIATDISGKGNDGTLDGGFEWVDGMFLGAVQFDDTGYMEVTEAGDFSFDEALTIMIWGNLSAVTPQEYVGMPRKENEYVIAAHTLGAQYEIGVWLNNGSWQGPFPALGTGPKLEYGEWHHFATTYDGEVSRIYVDGEEVGTGDIPGPLNATDAVLRISNSCCGGRFMIGAVDEVIMADETFTEAQIKEYYSIGATAVLGVEPQAKLATTWGQLRQ